VAYDTIRRGRLDPALFGLIRAFINERASGAIVSGPMRWLRDACRSFAKADAVFGHRFHGRAVACMYSSLYQTISFALGGSLTVKLPQSRRRILPAFCAAFGLFLRGNGGTRPASRGLICQF